MVEGYLIGARNLFDKWDHNNNYQIYIPTFRDKSINCLIGYFADKNMNSSKNRFYLSEKEISEKKKNKLNSKINKGKFVKKININDEMFMKFLYSAQNFKRSKEQYNRSFENLSEFLKE